jgi:YVTN family beta-propeller protein
MAKVTPNGRFALVTNAMFSVDGSPQVDSTVSVIDLIQWKLIDEIQVEAGPNGIEIDSVGRRAYVTNIRSNTVSVINIAARKVIATIPVGRAPFFDKLSFNGRLLVVTNFEDASLTLIDTTTLQVVNTIQVGEVGLTAPNPEFGPGDTTIVATAPNGVAYVANWRSSEIVLVNLITGKVLTSLFPVDNPFDIQIDTERGLIVVATYTTDIIKRLVVMDLETHKVITNIPTDGNAFPTGRASVRNYWFNDPLLQDPLVRSHRINAILPKGVKGIPVLFNGPSRHL